MAFKSTDLEDGFPIIDTSARRKDKFICQCGASKFIKLEEIGTLLPGGFRADTVTYKCGGCNHTYTDEEIHKYFK